MNAEQSVRVESGGVSVEKSYDPDSFPVPAIRFDVTSERDVPVVVTVVEQIPEGFTMERIGFHPEYESEHWTAFKDNRVEFERTLDAGESVTTVYGVRLDEDEDPAAFLSEPDLGTMIVDESEVPDEDDADDDPIAGVVPPESSQAVRDVISGKSDSIPGLGNGDDEEAESEAVAADADDGATADAPADAVDEAGEILGGADDADAEEGRTRPRPRRRRRAQRTPNPESSNRRPQQRPTTVPVTSTRTSR
ncbi:hypothetical protein ACFQH6_10030 [Halobacteriaceae archaeon GCM10025711]